MPGAFRTQTQWDWSRPCSESDAGCYLAQNFATVFPAGLTIGDATCGYGYTVTMTNLTELLKMLPRWGTPDRLTCSAVNPGDWGDPPALDRYFGGELGGRAMALTLNLGFDAGDPNFGCSSLSLGDLVVCQAGDPCDGMTVSGVLAEANRLLSACQSPLGYVEATACVKAIAMNFRDGLTVGQYLCLP